MNKTPTMQLVPNLLTFEQAAELLALPDQRYVRSIVARGDLACVKIGRYPRLLADDVRDYIERSTRRAPGQVKR